VEISKNQKRGINRPEERRTVYAAKVLIFWNTTLLRGYVRAKGPVSSIQAIFVF